jgi:hypothetical protein
MTEVSDRRWNRDPLWGLLLAIAAVAVNFAFFVSPPMQAVLPWLSLLIALTALVFLVRGLRRAFHQSYFYRGKVWSVVLAVVALAVAGLTFFGFFGARALPDSTAAPQVGQRVPDFTLADSDGQPVSLDRLFAPASGDFPTSAPKAVLLIFYRGYW